MTLAERLLQPLGVGPTADPDQAVEEAEALIKNNKVAVFSKSYCPYCIRALHTLTGLGEIKESNVIQLNHHVSGRPMQKHLAERIGAPLVTVPQIYIKGQLIGGCAELQALHSQGKLEPLLV